MCNVLLFIVTGKDLSKEKKGMVVIIQPLHCCTLGIYVLLPTPNSAGATRHQRLETLAEFSYTRVKITKVTLISTGALCYCMSHNWFLALYLLVLIFHDLLFPNMSQTSLVILSPYNRLWPRRLQANMLIIIFKKFQIIRWAHS